MSEETVVVENGRAWTNVRYLSSYFEADMLRKSLQARNEGLLEVKVKRCGESGGMYVVKSRDLLVKQSEEQPKKEKKVKKAKE